MRKSGSGYSGHRLPRLGVVVNARRAGGCVRTSRPRLLEVRLHVQQQVVLVLGLFVAHGTFELWVDAALEPHVSAQAVQARVRVAATGASVRRRRGGGRLREPSAAVPVTCDKRSHKQNKQR